jgi:AcrR family transcriptional regulator
MPTRRTQVERRQDSERALLDAAVAAIAERGITGASLSVIGERAGTSRGLPTHHFGSKDVLVARVAARAQDRVRAATESAIEEAHQDIDAFSALELIRATVDTYIGLFEQPTANERALIVMWGATFPSDSSIEGMLDADRASYEGWSDLIERGHRDGSIRFDADPAACAVLLHGLLRGVAASLLTESQYMDMTTVRTTIRDWIDGALGAATPQNASQFALTLRGTRSSSPSQVVE